MTTYTRQQLKHDKFVDATESSLSYVETHRNQVIGAAVAIVVVIAAIIAAATLYSQRAEAAQVAFGSALKTYTSPVRPAGVPADPTQESYASSQERARAGYQAFVAVADKYSSTPAGHDARYYAGVAAAEEGQYGTAEDQLKQAAAHASKDVAALAKMALANVYAATNQGQQVITTYQDLIDHPTTTVPANMARLQLASYYEQQKNIPAAKKLWAQVKDADKGTAGPSGVPSQPGMASQIAGQKLVQYK